jgi:hypothetical protein
VNLLHRSGVLRSASKSRNYAISGRRWHRVEQGLAARTRPIWRNWRTKLIRAATVRHHVVRRERWRAGGGSGAADRGIIFL